MGSASDAQKVVSGCDEGPAPAGLCKALASPCEPLATACIVLVDACLAVAECCEALSIRASPLQPLAQHMQRLAQHSTVLAHPRETRPHHWQVELGVVGQVPSVKRAILLLLPRAHIKVLKDALVH